MFGPTPLTGGSLRPPEDGVVTVDEAVAAYLADLRVSARSPSTEVSYRYGLERFVEFVDAREQLPADVGGLSIDNVVDFARWILSVPGGSRKTSDVYLSAVSGLYGFLVREWNLPLDLGRLRLRLRPLLGRRARAVPRVPSDDTVTRLLAAARGYRPAHNQGELVRLRNVALLEGLRGSGLRVAEAVSLRRGHLVAETRSAVVVGKGQKERVVFFSTTAWSAISDYHAALDSRGAGGGQDPVWQRHDDSARGRSLPLTGQGVRSVVAVVAHLAGVEERVTPHRFRAWFATRVVEQTGDLAAAQDLLGHESADTTRVYVKVRDDRLRKVHRSSFPDEWPRLPGF